MQNQSPQINLEGRYWLLHDHQLFSILNREQTKALCVIPEFKTAKKGEIIFFSHDEQDRIYTIKKGIMKVVEIDIDGNEIIKDILRAGDLFGQYTLSNTPSEEYAIAVSDRVVVCSFKVKDFEDVLESNPKLAIKYTKLVGFKLKRVTNLYANLMFKDVRTRFLLFLKDWAMKEAEGHTKNITIRNYLTHQDIANLICSTRQTVTELVNQLKKEGILDYSRQQIFIPDLQKL